MSPTDSMFLIAETREHPFHVGGLALYEPPAGADRDFVRELYEQMVAHTEVEPVFRKHPATILGGIANVGWTYDNDVDLDYHLRRSGLPSPGRVRDLLELTSRLHGGLLDRHRDRCAGGHARREPFQYRERSNARALVPNHVGCNKAPEFLTCGPLYTLVLDFCIIT